MKLSIVSALALPFFASAAVHNVAVGSGGLKFTPNSIVAAVGDTIAFTFDSAGHDVSEGNWKTGCTPYAKSAFYSGSGPQGKTWTMKVNSTSPTPFYCSSYDHCKSGMYGVINPSSTDSVSKYGSLAAKGGSGKSPSTVRGGTLS